MADRAAVLVALVVLLAAVAYVATRGAPAAVGQVDVDADFTAAEQVRAGDFQRRSRPLSLAGTAVSALWLFVMGLTPVGAAWVRAVGDHAVVELVLGAGSLLAVAWLLPLPFAVLARRVSLQFGLAAGTWRTWALDRVKTLVLSLVLSLAALGALLGLVTLLPHAWWWVSALAVAVLVVLLSFVVPVLVEPLFLRFRSLPEGPERTALLELAGRADVTVADVLVADASRRTTGVNAYVSGLGPTRRVVVFDTLLTGAPLAQVQVVVAHELGHVARRDVVWGTALGAVGAATATVVLSITLGWSWLLTAAGAGELPAPDALPLLLAVATLLGLLSSPLQSAVSRRVEARADIFALDLSLAAVGVADAAHTYAAMQRGLALTNLAPLGPNRVLQLWFGTHPTVPQRVALTRRWARERGADVSPLGGRR